MTRKNFCAAPWSGLSLQPDGQAKICCVSREGSPFESFRAIKDSPRFIQIRQAVIDDRRHENCEVCWQQENSTRQGDWNSRRSIYQYDDFYHDLDHADRFQMEHLDLRWSNACNLNCVYCGPYFSSRWADLLELRQRFKTRPAVEDRDLRNLEWLQMAGGEPLLIKENIDLLKRIQNINPKVKIEVTTNLTHLKNNAVYTLLKQFQDVTMVISFECTEKRFEYIRNGAVWSEFERNFERCVKDFHKVQASMVYFPLSALGIREAIDFAQDYIPASEIYIRDQEGGHGFDMLSDTALKYINNKTLEFSQSLDQQLKMRLLNLMYDKETGRSTSYLPDYDLFDQLTGQSHKNLFPEIYL